MVGHVVLRISRQVFNRRGKEGVVKADFKVVMVDFSLRLQAHLKYR